MVELLKLDNYAGPHAGTSTSVRSHFNVDAAVRGTGWVRACVDNIANLLR